MTLLIDGSAAPSTIFDGPPPRERGGDEVFIVWTVWMVWNHGGVPAAMMATGQYGRSA